MICQNCRWGADIPEHRILPGEPSKQEMHRRCEGKSQCACQHRTTRTTLEEQK